LSHLTQQNTSTQQPFARLARASYFLSERWINKKPPQTRNQIHHTTDD
jgi:hypothetical protein